MQLYDLRYLAFINLTFATNETINTRMIKNIIAKYLDENNLGNYYLERYTQDNVAIHERDIHLEEDYANIDNLFPPIIYVYAHTECEICTFKEYWNKYMKKVDVKELTLLSKDEFKKYKDNIKIFDWFWLRDDAIIEDTECWKELGPKLDKNGKQTVNVLGHPEYNYDIDGETEIIPLPKAYIVDDGSQDIETVSISRGDISLRFVMRFDTNDNLKQGTKLLYGTNERDLWVFTVLEDGLAFSDFVSGDTWWGEYESHTMDINECIKWTNSEAKKRCQNFYNENGNIAIVLKD